MKYALAIIATLVTFTARAEIIPGPVIADVLKVYDGDTATFSANIWPGLDMKESIRLKGFDTPERKSPKCEKEKRAAMEARDYLIKLIGKKVKLYDIGPTKFKNGARVETMTGIDIATAMIEAGHARPYSGGKRQSWCN